MRSFEIKPGIFFINVQAISKSFAASFTRILNLTPGSLSRPRSLAV
jgi:hypothetical protein